MPYSASPVLSLALNGATLVVPNLNPNLLYEVILRGGANVTNAVWYLRTSQNADGSSPDSGASDYRWSLRGRTSAAGAVDLSDDADSVVSFISISNGTWDRMQYRFLFDPGNGLITFNGMGTVTTTGFEGISQTTFGGGYINKTNSLALIVGISVGVATGTVYYKALA